MDLLGFPVKENSKNPQFLEASLSSARDPSPRTMKNTSLVLVFFYMHQCGLELKRRFDYNYTVLSKGV